MMIYGHLMSYVYIHTISLSWTKYSHYILGFNLSLTLKEGLGNHFTHTYMSILCWFINIYCSEHLERGYPGEKSPGAQEMICFSQLLWNSKFISRNPRDKELINCSEEAKLTKKESNHFWAKSRVKNGTAHPRRKAFFLDEMRGRWWKLISNSTYFWLISM